MDRFMAGFITTVLVSCPMVLKPSFSFMTDVPFLVWVIIALFLYTRAIRLQNYTWMIVASVAGSAAILTRQFGVALIGGLFLLWIVDGCHRRQLPLVLLGLFLPSIAVLWQIHFGAQTPTWAMAYSMTIQSQHVSDWRQLIGAALWRPAMVAQYLVFFTIPLGLWAIAALFKELFQNRKPTHELLARWNIRLLIGFTVYLLLVMSWTRDLMPLLDSYFNELRKLGLTAQALVTLFTVIGAIAYVRIFLLRFSSKEAWTQLPIQQRLLDLVTLFLFILILVFAQISGRYLLCLLPFPLIVIGKYLQHSSFGMRRMAVLTSVMVFAASAMWTRGSLEAEEALWRACEEVRLGGVNKSQIYGSLAWNCEHLFDEYLSGVGYDHGAERLGDFFIKWLPEMKKTATYLIVSEDDYRNTKQMSQGEIIARIPYTSTLFRRKWAVVIKRHAQGD
jgi:hypothetical protein